MKPAPPVTRVRLFAMDPLVVETGDGSPRKKPDYPKAVAPQNEAVTRNRKDFGTSMRWPTHALSAARSCGPSVPGLAERHERGRSMHPARRASGAAGGR